MLGRRRRDLISETACDRELSELARERGFIERNLKLAENQLLGRAAREEQRRDLEARVAALRARLSEATFEERRELLRSIAPTGVGRIVLHAGGKIDLIGVLELGDGRVPMDISITVRAG